MATKTSKGNLAREKANRDQATKRQRDRRKKLKESGLQPVTLYFDEATRKALQKLHTKYGYDIVDNYGYSQSEIDSRIVAYCIRRAARYKKMVLPETPRNRKAYNAGQLIYSLRAVIKHRQELANEGSMAIARFMNKHGYPTPDQVLSFNKISSLSHRKALWKAVDVDYILKDEEMIDSLDLIEANADQVEKPTSKKKTAKLKS